MYLFVTSAMGMFEQQNTRAGTNEFSFSAQHIGSVNIRCNERANSFLYLSCYLVKHFFSLCSFQNIISRCVATIFFPCLFCFIVVSLLHNLPCFHVSFFILVGFFSLVLYFIQRQPNLIYLVSLNCMSFVLLWWILFPFHSVHHYFIRAHIHTYMHWRYYDANKMWNKKLRKCFRPYLINKRWEMCKNSRNLMHFHDHWVNAVNRTHFIYFHYSACLIKDHSICSCTVEKSERISDIN